MAKTTSSVIPGEHRKTRNPSKTRQRGEIEPAPLLPIAVSISFSLAAHSPAGTGDSPGRAWDRLRGHDEILPLKLQGQSNEFTL